MIKMYKAKDYYQKVLYKTGEVLEFDGTPESLSEFNIACERDEKTNRWFINTAVGSLEIKKNDYVFRSFDEFIFLFKPDALNELFEEVTDEQVIKLIYRSWEEARNFSFKSNFLCKKK